MQIVKRSGNGGKDMTEKRGTNAFALTPPADGGNDQVPLAVEISPIQRLAPLGLPQDGAKSLDYFIWNGTGRVCHATNNQTVLGDNANISRPLFQHFADTAGTRMKEIINIRHSGLKARERMRF